MLARLESPKDDKSDFKVNHSGWLAGKVQPFL
jgi:hypothetical protein